MIFPLATVKEQHFPISPTRSLPGTSETQTHTQRQADWLKFLYLYSRLVPGPTYDTLATYQYCRRLNESCAPCTQDYRYHLTAPKQVPDTRSYPRRVVLGRDRSGDKIERIGRLPAHSFVLDRMHRCWRQLGAMNHVGDTTWLLLQDPPGPPCFAFRSVCSDLIRGTLLVPHRSRYLIYTLTSTSYLLSPNGCRFYV
jgi:hypothetical protein